MSDKLYTRAAAAGRSTVNETDRTVELVFATDAPYRRSGWDGTYDEILTISPDAINLERMDAGMSLVDAHQNYSTASRIGSVMPGSFRIDGNQALVTVKFSKKPAAEELWQDLLDGHMLPVSVGYRIDTKTETTPAAGEVATVTATRWTPYEISIVPIPADAGAHTRQYETDTKALAERAEKFRTLAKQFNITDEAWIQRQIFSDVAEADFGKRILEHKADTQDMSPTYPTLDPTAGLGNARQQLLRTAEDALFARAMGRAPTMPAANQYVRMSIFQLAEDMVAGTGANVRALTQTEVLQRAFHTTSDFPILLGNTIRRILQEQYELVQSPMKAVCKPSTKRDFRAATIVKMGDMGALQKLNEHGEIVATTLSEASEGYRLETYARAINITRQMIINDDLSVFTQIPQMFARAAAVTEGDLLFALLSANPTMNEDGKPLFHADHGNTSVLPMTPDNLGTIRTNMRKQRAPGGLGFMNVAPSLLLVPPDLEMTAQKLITEIAATKMDDVNPWPTTISYVVEPRLGPKTWFAFADPALVPTIEYSYLDAASGPQVEQDSDWSIMGVKYRCWLDFGAGAVDWRGAYRNVIP